MPDKKDCSEPKVFNAISLGGGVQSSTMALMAAKGEILPMPDCAIFSDTQAEPKSVYDYLDYLEPLLPFPVYRVTAGSLAEEGLRMRTTKDGRAFAKINIPLFTLSPTGEKGKIQHRSCTFDFKIKPLLKKLRTLARIKRGQKTVGAVSWIGISWDERQRMKDSREPWAENRFPLIEKYMDRTACLDWMQKNGYRKPPRSSCVFCPFHTNAEWRRLQTKEPEEFERAVQFERDIRSVKAKTENFDSVPFLHRSCKPLDQIDFRSEVEKGQKEFGFQEECEGFCGG